MAKVNISEAIQLSRLSRQTFYSKYLNPGKISVELDPQGRKCIDTAELIRVFGSIDLDIVDKSKIDDFRLGQIGQGGAKDAEIALLREQLRLAMERERAAEERERWYQSQVEALTGAIKLLEHKPEEQQPKRGFWSRFFGRDV